MPHVASRGLAMRHPDSESRVCNNAAHFTMEPRAVRYCATANEPGAMKPVNTLALFSWYGTPLKLHQSDDLIAEVHSMRGRGALMGDYEQQSSIRIDEYSNAHNTINFYVALRKRLPRP